MQPMFIQFYQFCRFACQREELGLNCKKEEVKRKKSKQKPNPRRSQRTQTRLDAQNVVGHDIVPRKLPSQRERTQERRMSFHTTFWVRSTTLPHGILRIWRSENTREESFPTTFQPTLHGNFRTEIRRRDQFHAARHFIPRNSFYTTFSAQNL